MSEVCDEWRRQIRAVLGDEALECNGLWTPSNASSVSFSSSFSHSFSSSSPQPQVNLIPANKSKKPSVVLSLGGLLARSWRFGRIGGKKYGFELYPGEIFNVNQLKAATNNFHPANKIGGAGSVYKGVLPGGVEIAVKRLLPESKQGVQDIINEIGTICALQHQNLARPIICCPAENQILLIYEFMKNISLEHALFGSDEVKSRINWRTRVRICLGIAKGLAFLHEDAELHTIIHGNIKPSNILLDEDYDVKISDFRYPQLHVTSGNMPLAKPTGYMAPEYIQGYHLTPKADVYSFGIIMLELFSGQKNKTFRSKGESIYLLNEAYQYQKQNNLIALVDPVLRNDYNFREANKILDLAMDCVSPSFDLRPTMSQAVKFLEGNIKLQTRQTSTPPPLRDLILAQPLADFSQSGSTSPEKSDTALCLSTSKEIDDDSIISVD